MYETLKICALKEIEEQSFELTKSYLSVNKLVYKDNNEPKIDDVIIKEEEQTAAVYFSIENEDYYFVIYLGRV